jgi:alkylated DNA repair dioxygenase AlkB
MSQPSETADDVARGLPAGFRYLPDVLAPEQAAQQFAALLAETPWETHTLAMFGRRVEMPRRICMFGPRGYRYSGVVHPPRQLSPRLQQLLAEVEAAAGARFNSVLLNLYRDGRDSVAWHSDDDYDHGGQPVIGSLSLGATRRFQIRSRSLPRRDHAIDLAGGSVLVMAGDSQRCWQHRLPRTARPVGPRINLTFRWMVG